MASFNKFSKEIDFLSKDEFLILLISFGNRFLISFLG
jgi:hypothetical protein